MRILKIKREKLKRIVEITAKAIKQGKVVVCPTDTVYGLLTDAANKKAVERLFKIKKRQKGKPIPIFVKDIKTAKKLAFIDEDQQKFLKKVWPGKITTVLVKREKTKIFGIGLKTVAIRIPNYKLINILLEKLNRPLIGTSANISGKPASTKIQEVTAQFTKRSIKPDLVIDAGDIEKSNPSNIIDLTGKKPKILRP